MLLFLLFRVRAAGFKLCLPGILFDEKTKYERSLGHDDVLSYVCCLCFASSSSASSSSSSFSSASLSLFVKETAPFHHDKKTRF